MGRQRWFLVVLVAVVVALVACAPKAVPVPAPTPAVPAAPAAPAITPEEAAWAKVVEAAKKEGKLTFYSFHLYADIGLAVQKAFTERTGIKLDVISGPSATLIERIKAERRAGQQVPSLLSGITTMLTQAKIDGITEAAGPLPELQNKEVWEVSPIFDKEGHILVSGFSLPGPWINTKLVKLGEEPRSWRDLLQPRWKNKISILDPDTQALPNANYYILVKKHGILDDAYFRELGKLVVFHPTIRMSGEAVARGDVDISLFNAASAMAPFLQAGAPVKALNMEEGLIGSFSPAVSLLSQAPHPNAARVFVNWWFSREGQLVFHKASGTQSTRKDVPNFLPAAAQLTPKKVMWSSAEADVEATAVMRERVLKRIMVGK